MQNTLEAIKKLNKVTLFFIRKNKKLTSGVEDSASDNNKVELYTNQGWNFNFAIDTSSALGQMNLVKNPMVSATLTSITGKAMIVDFERKYVLSGTQPLKFSLKCYRVLENSVEEDIYKPINTLLSWLLPVRNNESIGGQVNQAVKSVFGTGSWISSIVDSIEKFTGKAYFVEVPEIFKKDDCHLVLKIGGQYVKGVMLTSVVINSPRFSYADDKGKPIPEYVEITLNLETLRGAIKSDYEFK